MRLVGDGAWGEPADPAEARRVLQRAVELGVNLIDTADAYGPEIAERLIAEALYPYPAGLVIATKGGITRQGPAKTEYVGRAGYLIQCVEMSLRRLKLERIDLYQLHRIDPRTPLEESLGALKQMQEQGKIRHIGLSEVTPAEIEEARKLVPHNSATSLQVTAAAMAGVIWAMKNPARDVVEPDDLPFDEMLALCRPYLGDVVGAYSDWTPLHGRNWLFDEDIDPDDPWQFKNFRVS